MDKFIGNKDTLLGYLTFGDFHLFGLLDLTSIVSANLFGESIIKKNYKGLEALYENIKKIGTEFLSRPENKLPFYPPSYTKVDTMQKWWGREIITKIILLHIYFSLNII